MGVKESIDSQIYKKTISMAEDLVDMKGKEFAEYDEDILSMDDLKDLAFLLFKKKEEDYSWLVKNEDFKKILFHFLNNEEEAENDLGFVINLALIAYFRTEMKRLVNFSIRELKMKREI